MQLSRQDVEAFMQQKGCPALPDHIPEWQTPHLAKPPPEAEEDEELDEEAAEAKMQEERLAVGEGLVGDLAAVRTKRDHSPDNSQDSEEPDSKKQKVGCCLRRASIPLNGCTKWTAVWLCRMADTDATQCAVLFCGKFCGKYFDGRTKQGCQGFGALLDTGTILVCPMC